MRAKKTDKDYYELVSQAVKYMHTAGITTVSSSDLAKAAFLSEPQFRRVFSRCMGEPPKQYIQKLRLSIAYSQLKDSTHKSVLAAAMACGYESHSSFCRAFRNFYGFKPSKLPGDNALPFWRKLSAYQQYEADEFAPKYMYWPAFNYLYVGKQYSNSLSYYDLTQASTSELFRQLKKQHLDPRKGKFFGLYSFDQTPGGCGRPQFSVAYHNAKVQFDQFLPADDDTLKIGKISTGWWAMFEHIGPPEHAWQTWNKVQALWVASGRIKLKNNLVIEPYLFYKRNQFNRAPKTFVCIPVEKKG